MEDGKGGESHEEEAREAEPRRSRRPQNRPARPAPRFSGQETTKTQNPRKATTLIIARTSSLLLNSVALVLGAAAVSLFAPPFPVPLPTLADCGSSSSLSSSSSPLRRLPRIFSLFIVISSSIFSLSFFLCPFVFFSYLSLSSCCFLFIIFLRLPFRHF